MTTVDQTVPPAMTISQGMAKLNELPQQFMVVIDNDKIVGTVTDGDIRRALLADIPLDAPISRAMNPKPITANANQSFAQLNSLMVRLSLKFLPLVDHDRRLVRVFRSDEMTSEKPLNQALIMAGGLGMRLRPYTEKTPKPMLEIGGIPLLETLVRQLAGYGFSDITLSISYLGEQVIDHFGDGSSLGLKITYITEDQRMGTAGSATLIQPLPQRPLLITNGDILTNVNFRSFMDFHLSTSADLTMGVRTFSQQVPYGVVNTRGLDITSIEEKPTLDFFVNAGIYVIEPSVLAELEKSPLDMTDLVEKLLGQDGRRVAACPVHEYWQDIGREDDLLRARADYNGIFGHLSSTSH